MNSARPLIVQRLLNASPALPFSSIRGTSNVLSVLRTNWQSPACFVWRYSSKNAQPDKSNCAIQPVDSVYAVLFALKTEKDDGSVEDEAEKLSFMTMQQLLGWRPFNQGQLEYVDGEAMTQLERNLLFWRDSYQLRHNIVLSGG